MFGPGTGELVVVRAPPDNWMVIDGCGVGEALYAPMLLAHFNAHPDIVLFTHPHSDHYRGLQEVIDAATQDENAAWPLLGMVAPPEADRRTAPLTELVAYLSEGGSEQVVSAFRDRWERKPACKWTLQPGSTRQLGDALVRVLSPTVEMRQVAQWNFDQNKAFDKNQISAAIEIEWSGHRFILGSDLVEKPGKGWTEALKVQAALASHSSFKIPHHGSIKGMHAEILGRAGRNASPVWALTPFASRDLPRLSIDGGIDQLLAQVQAIELTALPRPHGMQSAAAEEFRIGALRPDGRHLVFDPSTPGFPDCFVAIEMRSDGSSGVARGPGSVRVTR